MKDTDHGSAVLSAPAPKASATTALPVWAGEQLPGSNRDRSFRATRLGKGLAITGAFVAALVGLGWAGLQVQPAPFPPAAQPSRPMETIPIPAGLPAPVERFYRVTYGDQIPVIRTAVITGRGTIRLANVTLPMRFRFTHESGRNYRHYIEPTVFGLPVAKVNEHYVDGKERMETPVGTDENNPKLDQGGNTGMWAESLLWMPAILLTDPRVRWEPVDDATAILVVPFEGRGEERFVIRFDPATGKTQHFEVMRYKNGAGEKILWIDGMWLDEGRPWANFVAEEVVFNADVKVSMDDRGP